MCLEHYYGEGVTFGCGLSEMELFFAGRQVRPRTHSDWNKYGPFLLAAASLVAHYALPIQWPPFFYYYFLSITFPIFARLTFHFTQLAIYSVVCEVTRIQSHKKHIYMKSEKILAVNQLQILALSSVQSDCYYMKC